MTSRLRSLFSVFRTDTRGGATVEFVIALPILLAIMGFSVQYGHALSVRNSLDIASRDAARYLARAPLSTSGDIDPVFLINAYDIIDSRVSGGDSVITDFTPTSTTANATISVTVNVRFPLLKIISLFDSSDPTVALTATESWARSGTLVYTANSSGIDLNSGGSGIPDVLSP